MEAVQTGGAQFGYDWEDEIHTAQDAVAIAGLAAATLGIGTVLADKMRQDAAKEFHSAPWASVESELTYDEVMDMPEDEVNAYLGKRGTNCQGLDLVAKRALMWGLITAGIRSATYYGGRALEGSGGYVPEWQEAGFSSWRDYQNYLQFYKLDTRLKEKQMDASWSEAEFQEKMAQREALQAQEESWEDMDITHVLKEKGAVYSYLTDVLGYEPSEASRLVGLIQEGAIDINSLPEDWGDEELSNADFETAIELYNAEADPESWMPEEWEDIVDADLLPELSESGPSPEEGEGSISEEWPQPGEDAFISGDSEEAAGLSPGESATFEGDENMSFYNRGYGRGGGVRVGRRYVFSDTPRPGFYYRRFRNGTGAYVKPRRY